MPTIEDIRTKPLPKTLERTNLSPTGFHSRPGAVQLNIRDMAHFNDLLRYARKHDVLEQLGLGLLNLLSLAGAYAGAQGDRQGQEMKLELFQGIGTKGVDPSLEWALYHQDGKLAYAGGLICWPESRSWSIHT